MIIFQTWLLLSCLFLESENPEKDISIYINSPGGVISSGLAIYDTMQFIAPEVSTLCALVRLQAWDHLLLAGGAERQEICFNEFYES